jgi:hypothetical protein
VHADVHAYGRSVTPSLSIGTNILEPALRRKYLALKLTLTTGLPMRTFKLDGKSWIARIHDSANKEGNGGRIGWEVVQFDTNPSGSTQRITYRPAGWLTEASINELIDALREGETVRAAWRE